MIDWASEEALTPITGDAGSKALVEKLRSADNIVQSAADTVANLVKSVAGGAEQQFKIQLDQSELYNVGALVAQHIANLAQASRLIGPSQQDMSQFFGKVLTNSIDYFTGKAQSDQKAQQVVSTANQTAQQPGVISQSMGAQ